MTPSPPALPLFVYGTLRDPAVLAAVIGRRLAPGRARPATAPGFRAVYYPGHTFPAMIAATGDAAPGLVLYGLGDTEIAALDVYEGDDYVRARVTVVTGTDPVSAWAYRPAITIAHDAPAWTLEQWNERHRPGIMGDTPEEDVNV